jgi:hypothetical protein
MILTDWVQWEGLRDTEAVTTTIKVVVLVVEVVVVVV